MTSIHAIQSKIKERESNGFNIHKLEIVGEHAVEWPVRPDRLANVADSQIQNIEAYFKSLGYEVREEEAPCIEGGTEHTLVISRQFAARPPA